MVLRDEFNLEKLIREAMWYCDKSYIPLTFLQHVKKLGKEDLLEKAFNEHFDFSEGDPYIEDVMQWLTEDSETLKRVFNNMRPITARELFGMDDKVYLKTNKGEDCLIFSLSIYNELEICFQPDSGSEYYDWYSVEDLIKKGFTFKDGSSLFINKDDPLFKEN